MKRRVLVTGASGGIGCAIARTLADAGFHLTLHYRRDRQSAEKTAMAIRKNGERPRLINFDVTDRNASRHALEQKESHSGPII